MPTTTTNIVYIRFEEDPISPALRAKLLWTLLPPLWLAYMLLIIDRSNFAVAQLGGPNNTAPHGMAQPGHEPRQPANPLVLSTGAAIHRGQALQGEWHEVWRRIGVAIDAPLCTCNHRVDDRRR